MAEKSGVQARTQESKQKYSNFRNQKPRYGSSGSPADRILQLQRTAGNQAVQRLIKATNSSKKEEQLSGKLSAIPEKTADSKKVSAPHSRKENEPLTAAEKYVSQEDVNDTAVEETLQSPVTSQKAPASPEEDAAYQAVVKKLEIKAKNKRTPFKKPEQKQKETILAANAASREIIAKQNAYNTHLDTLEQVQPHELTVEKFMDEFKKTSDELVANLPENKEKHGTVQTVVNLVTGRTKAAQELANQKKANSDPLRTEVKKPASEYQDNKQQESKIYKLKVDPAGSTPIIKHAEMAAPKPKTDDAISLDEKSSALDDALLNHNVNGQTINIDEGSLSYPISGEKTFDEAGKAKRKAQDEIASARPKYREEERAVISKSRDNMQSLVNTGLQDYNNLRSQSFSEVLSAQNKHAGKIEGEKQSVFSDFQKIYEDTKEQVNEKLNELNNIEETFESILSKAEERFKYFVKTNLEYIYTPGFFDYSDWKDKHESEIKEELKKLLSRDEYGYQGRILAHSKAIKNVQDRSADILFKDAKDEFTFIVTREVEEKIAKKVVNSLNAAKKCIEEGKRKADKKFEELNPKEKAEAEQVFEAVKGQFETLEESVEDRQHEVIKDMAQTYNRSAGKLKATFDTIKKDVLTSWFEKAWNKLKAIVNAIIEFATRIAELLGRIAYLVGDIVSSPRYFFKNLVTGIGQGFSTFVDRIDEFLSTAFFDWLRGSSGMPIQIPKNWGPKGIFSLFTQLLNLSTETIWERMEVVYSRTIANAFRRGEVLLERGLEIFSAIKNEGLGGMWDHIKESLGNILEETLGMIKETVLYAAIKKVIFEIGKMLVPGGGFIAIAEKVIRLLQFIVEARNNILDLIESFVDSIEMAVKGNIPGIVNRITGALTKFITVALDFLVSFFGLGSLKEKVERLIQRMRKPIIRGIDWVLGKFKPLVMKGKELFEKGKAKVIEAGKAVVQVGVPEDPNERLRLAVQASVSAAKKLTGRVTQALLNPILTGIKVRYGLTAIRPYEKSGSWWVKATINPEVDQDLGVPSKEEVSVGNIKVLIFRVSETVVRIELPETGDQAIIDKRASNLVKLELLMKDLALERNEAEKLLRNIRGADLDKVMLWAAFAIQPAMQKGPEGEKPIEGYTTPDRFVISQLREQRATTAAVASLPGRETRARLVHHGEEEVGGSTREPLSRFAVVFRPYDMGKWKSRTNPVAKMTEYIYEGEGSRPDVVALGAIEVDNSGKVIRILEVSEKLKGGEAKFIKLMEAAGWTIALET
ncbi:hypothetical protein [Methanosarcina sp.]|uniref:hypothetical protein n=1 Tax=Methanosarcina sp. TaxID=2213 RepID=UPI002ABB891D|nr:hypothetical protein [Methanosarcina sp.]MDY9927087.1 hypothetical protein [Methanosarcina sp.]